MNPTHDVAYLQTAILPPHQEAAVMFAAGHTEDARVLLENLVASPDSQADPRTWALLFTLYRSEGDWARFDALTSRFQSRFQRPAPGWQGAEVQAGLPPWPRRPTCIFPWPGLHKGIGRTGIAGEIC